MKALVCHQYGPPETLTVEELPSPRPGPGEALVQVKAASVNFPDVLIVQNRYQVRPPLPFTPGSELAGVVKSVGAGVAAPRPGDRVIAFTTWGAFAEECVVPAHRLVPMPAGMDFETAASFLLTYGTSHHALRHRVEVRSGETLVVLGAAGGVGLAAVEIGKVLGLRVIACASSEEKLALCRAHGADETVNYTTDDLREAIRGLTGGAGADIVYDAVGGPYAEAALRASAWRARYLVVGFAAGEIPRIPLNLALLMERSIVGVYWGEWTRRAPAELSAAVEELGRWHAEGKLRPHVSGRYPLARAAEAIAALAGRRALGKIVVVP